MKRIIFAFLAVFALTACNNKANAQITLYKSTGPISGITTQTSDTLDNAETTYFSTRTGDLNKYTTANYTAYFMLNTNSGTTAGTIIQEGSNDGITWFPISGAMALGTDGYNCDSLTLASSYTTSMKTMTTVSGAVKYVNGATRGNCASRVLYYRLKVVGSGTQATRIYSIKLLPFTK
jgi:hypothetical protein